MKGSEKKYRVGIAALLEKGEIKEYLDTLFLLIGGIEFVIFLAHFIASIGPEKKAFPWKQYFFISFISPVGLIFIIGLIVIGFNYYLYGNKDFSFSLEESPLVGSKIKKFGHSFRFLLSVIQQVPVLAGLFFLGIGSVILFKLDVILQVLGHVGERTAFYLFIILCVFVAGGLIFLLFFLYYKFKLHKYQIRQQWEFRQKVVETTGLIILDNNKVFNKKGEIVSNDGMIEDGKAPEKKIPLLVEKLFAKQ